MRGKGKKIQGKVPVKEGLFPWPPPEDDDPYLIGSRCGACGRHFFPKRPLCPHCQEKGEMLEIPLSRNGILYTYTIIRQGPSRFRPPYATALVDLPEGVRIFTQLTTSDPDEMVLDGPVELTFGPIAVDKEGNEVISYLFKPVDQASKEK